MKEKMLDGKVAIVSGASYGMGQTMAELFASEGAKVVMTARGKEKLDTAVEEIRAKDYSLIPSEYIEFVDHDLEIDYDVEMRRIQSEVRSILSNEYESQELLKNAFKGIGYGIE